MENIIIILIILLISASILMLRKILTSQKRTRSTTGEQNRRFDNYLLKRRIKIGGMATIWEAVDLSSKQKVAVKEMHENFMDDQDLTYKFFHEAEILNTLNTKYPEARIVKVYKYGRENNNPGGRPFIVLELIHGEDLEDRLSSTGAFSLDEATKIIYDVANSLSFAHKENIWHRDISPGNIMVTEEEIIIIDFGIAKHEYLGRKTLDGSTHGNPPYMSPEQCTNKKVDGRTDIYSLGIIFFTLLTGKPPFYGKNPIEVIKMHETAPVPPLPNNVPDEIKSIINKMLNKDPQDRYYSLRDVLIEIESYTGYKSNVNECERVAKEHKESTTNYSNKERKFISKLTWQNSPKKVVYISSIILVLGSLFFLRNSLNNSEDRIAEDRTASIDPPFIIKEAPPLYILNTNLSNVIGQLNEKQINKTYEFIYDITKRDLTIISPTEIVWNDLTNNELIITVTTTIPPEE
jgi:serine/threonine protein kinase